MCFFDKYLDYAPMCIHHVQKLIRTRRKHTKNTVVMCATRLRRSFGLHSSAKDKRTLRMSQALLQSHARRTRRQNARPARRVPCHVGLRFVWLQLWQNTRGCFGLLHHVLCHHETSKLSMDHILIADIQIYEWCAKQQR